MTDDHRIWFINPGGKVIAVYLPGRFFIYRVPRRPRLRRLAEWALGLGEQP